MAKQRYVRTSFRTDKYIEELLPSEKLIFLYLLTNECTNLCGIYEISIKRISFETGLEKNEVESILNKFTEDKRIIYLHGFVCIFNYIKNQSTNLSMVEGMKREFSSLPPVLIEELDRLGASMIWRKTGWSTLPYLTLPNSTKLNLTEPDVTETPPAENISTPLPQGEKIEWAQKNRAVDTKGKMLVTYRNTIMGKNDLMDKQTKDGFLNFIYDVDGEDFKKRVELFKKCYDLAIEHSLNKYTFHQIQTYTIGQFLKNINLFSGSIYDVFDKITNQDYKNKVRKIISSIDKDPAPMFEKPHEFHPPKFDPMLTSSQEPKHIPTQEEINEHKKALLSKLRPTSGL